MKLVYVAGPYRASHPWMVELNIRAAEEVAHKLLDLEPNIVPVVPHSMYRYFDGTRDDQYWLDATMQLLLRCDELVMLPNWLTSEGTIGEFLAAVGMEMPIHIYQPELEGLPSGLHTLDGEEIETLVELAKYELEGKYLKDSPFREIALEES